METRVLAGRQALRDSFEQFWSNPRSVDLAQGLIDAYREAPRTRGW